MRCARVLDWNDNVNFEMRSKCRLFTKFLANICLNTPSPTIYVRVYKFMYIKFIVDIDDEDWSVSIIFTIVTLTKKKKSIAHCHRIKIQMFFFPLSSFNVASHSIAFSFPVCRFIIAGNGFMRICLHLCELKWNPSFIGKQIDDLFYTALTKFHIWLQTFLWFLSYDVLRALHIWRRIF